MIQSTWIGLLLTGIAVACAVTTLACATASTIVTLPLVPEGTPNRRPQPSEYDHLKISCGTALYPEPIFVGRTVRRTPSGELVSLLGVTAVLESHGTVHATATPTPITIKQDRNGRFSYHLVLNSDTLVYYKGDVAVGWEDVDDTAALTFQAPGCEPLRVEFKHPGQEELLELRCAEGNNPGP